MSELRFFSKRTKFKLLHPRKTSRWIASIAKTEKVVIGTLHFIFCSDQFLLEINRRFLKQDSYTDIVTFDLSDNKNSVDGEIYISVPRVKENALRYSISFDEELHRVMIHGLLHLAGYRDKSPREKIQMREREEACLSLRSSFT